MYPMAGIAIWLALGALIGFFTGKVTGAHGPFNVGSNTGVGMVAAVFSGFVTTVLFNGEKNNTGMWVSILVAGTSAIIALAIVRAIYGNRPPRFEDSATRLR